jgi:predicted amidophosphoribosyltransferase
MSPRAEPRAKQPSAAPGFPALRENAALLAESALGFVYPRRCPFCGEVLGTLPACPACAPELARLALAHRRLSPDTHYFGDLGGAAAVFRYEGCARAAVLRIKYGGRPRGGRDLGNCMAQALFGCTFRRKYAILLPERASAAGMGYDVIVPVPASDSGRGYNVPELLAAPLHTALGLPVQPQALERRHFMRHQAGLPLSDRLANVAGAFVPARGCDVEGRRVLLVDDVITTGATAAACAAALLAAGAQSVEAAALASSQWQREDEADAQPLPEEE